MSDLIDRQDALDAVDIGNLHRGIVDALQNIISEIPSAQPEIVRCKSCKRHEDEEPGMVYCPYCVGGWVSNDFFCGNGTRCDMRVKERE